MASPRSTSFTILSKMRRCASRKKSAESITSAARLNASLWRRIAPSTDRSASRLCGSVRSATAVSGISVGRGRQRVYPKRKRPEKKKHLRPHSRLRLQTSNFRLHTFLFLFFPTFGNHPNSHVRRDLAVQLHRHG